MIYYVVGYENICCVYILFDYVRLIKHKQVFTAYFNNLF